MLNHKPNSNWTPAVWIASSGMAGLCKDSWGPFNPDFQLTSCFIDGPLYGGLAVLLLVFGTYKIHSLIGRRSLGAPVNWHFWLKLVSICAMIMVLY